MTSIGDSSVDCQPANSTPIRLLCHALFIRPFCFGRRRRKVIPTSFSFFHIVFLLSKKYVKLSYIRKILINTEGIYNLKNQQKMNLASCVPRRSRSSATNLQGKSFRRRRDWTRRPKDRYLTLNRLSYEATVQRFVKCFLYRFQNNVLFLLT